MLMLYLNHFAPYASRPVSDGTQKDMACIVGTHGVIHRGILGRSSLHLSRELVPWRVLQAAFTGAAGFQLGVVAAVQSRLPTAEGLLYSPWFPRLGGPTSPVVAG